MQLFDDMARQRAQIYRWFSLLLFQELSDEALAGLRDKNNLVLMNGLKFIPELLLPTRQFQRRLCAALKRKARQQELAADFASLFLLPSPTGVSPYAGHYPHTTPSEERRIMRQWLVELELAPENNEAADHIAIQLALMAALIEGDPHSEILLAQQYHFLHQHLLVWLPLFSKRSYQRDNFGFYAAAIGLLLRFIQLDIEWIIDSFPMRDSNEG